MGRIWLGKANQIRITHMPFVSGMYISGEHVTSYMYSMQVHVLLPMN